MIPLSRYRQTQNETASPERLMVLLFEAGLRSIRMGIAALQNGANTEAVRHLTHASEIVVELQSTLDRSRAPELCENLSRVYEFTSFRLVDAAAHHDVLAAREAEKVFAPVAGAFAEAVASLGKR